LLDGENVLLIQRGKPPSVGKWSIPGGKVELGESLETAALRELQEETGLTCTLGPIVEILDRITLGPDGSIQYHFVSRDSVARAPRGLRAAASDCLDARFVPISELGQYDLTDGLEPVIARARTLRDGPVRVHQTRVS
jgi:ADP-ribose pyrophosphatase YjhB (NUDIX family)